MHRRRELYQQARETNLKHIKKKLIEISSEMWNFFDRTLGKYTGFNWTIGVKEDVNLIIQKYFLI